MARRRVAETPSRRRLAVGALVLVAGWSLLWGQPVSSRPILIIGGTLFDGETAPRPNDALLIEDGRISRLGADAERRAPRDARTIAATGQWILPGLVDAHVHFFQTGGLDARPDIVPHPEGRAYTAVVDGIRRAPQAFLRAYVCAGVTSVVDFGGPSWVFDLRDTRADDPLSPRIAFSGPLLATRDPAPLELDDDEPLWLMKDEQTVRVRIAQLAARGADYVKIWFATRAADPDFDRWAALVGAAIGEAHARGLEAAVHATSLRAARVAVEAGADVLVHGVADVDVDETFVREVVARGVVYIPTLIVIARYADLAAGQLSFTEFERACAPPSSVASFEALAARPAGASRREAVDAADRLRVPMRNLKRLAEAGAIIAAGSDAGNTGTLHGPSLHRELALMAGAGLAPIDVLRAATGRGGRLMTRRRDLGRLRVGAPADVLVLDADPFADIRHTTRIHTVIRGGALYHR